VDTLTQNSEREIRELLLGRKIIAAEQGTFKFGDGWDKSADGKLTLDNGAVVFVVPNEGCGGCSAGWYEIEHLTTVENAITSVRLTEEVESDEFYEPDRSYRIYVIADNKEINVVQIDGNDGNGYYGTGYELIVQPTT
jgi:hypothetical protein